MLLDDEAKNVVEFKRLRIAEPFTCTFLLFGAFVFGVVVVDTEDDAELKKLCSLDNGSGAPKSFVASLAESISRCNLGKCDFVEPRLASKQAVHISWLIAWLGILNSWHWMSRLRRLIFSRASYATLS